jgi:hypothetical protein
MRFRAYWQASVVVAAGLVCGGCSSEQPIVSSDASSDPTPPIPRTESQANPMSNAATRRLTHKETLQWIAQQRAWRRARKTRPIWVRALDADELGREFMTADHVAEKARAGFVLCVGVAGEPWFQKLEKVESKYNAGDLVSRQFDFDSQEREYRVYSPKDSTRNWAAQVTDESSEGFEIRPNYDVEHPLYSPRGGYVVKDDVEDPYAGDPDDVWLVQQGLFESTYEFVQE